MKVLTGDDAILSDADPLAPQVTLRLASLLDPSCNCGDAPTFVLLKADIAKHAPHWPNLEDRVSYAWVHVHQSVCSNHLAVAVRDMGASLVIEDTVVGVPGASDR